MKITLDGKSGYQLFPKVRRLNLNSVSAPPTFMFFNDDGRGVNERATINLEDIGNQIDKIAPWLSSVHAVPNILDEECTDYSGFYCASSREIFVAYRDFRYMGLNSSAFMRTLNRELFHAVEDFIGRAYSYRLFV